MTLQFLGHSAFRIITDAGKTILIDPWLDGNPLAPLKARDLKADVIILSHAHGDHLGDAMQIASRADTLFIAVSELTKYISAKGFKTHAMQIGGAYNFDFARVRLSPALHGSMTPDGCYAGLAAGIILTLSGKTIYHCGDTGLFLDMKLIGEMHEIDIMLVPVGGNYTMDIPDALLAVKWVQPKLAIPMHYNTFPPIKCDPEPFRKGVQELGFQCIIMQAGEEIAL